MLTVFASAEGPALLAKVKFQTGSYLPAIIGLGFTAAALALGAVLVPIPPERDLEEVFAQDIVTVEGLPLEEAT
jgi:hypothetical protein